MPLMRKVLAVTPLEEERYANPGAARSATRVHRGFLEVMSGYDQYRAWAEVIRHRLPITVGDTFQIVRSADPSGRGRAGMEDPDGPRRQGRVLGGDMSFGSISDPAHRDMAIAYNLVGSTIGTGEGGIPLSHETIVQR